MVHTASLTWIEINKAAFNHNMLQLREVVGQHTVIAPVLKANAYGHGIMQMQQLCQEHAEVNWVCVVSLSDAIALRSCGFSKPILVVGYCDAELKEAIVRDIDIVVYEIGMLKELSRLATAVQKTVHVHIKIDTGMSRLGIFAHQALSLYEYARSLPGIIVRGIASHFARAGAADLAVSEQQLERFAVAVGTIEQRGYTIDYKHMASSAGMFVAPHPRYNFVRPGRHIYGLWTSEATKQRATSRYPALAPMPVMSWKCRIVQIKVIPKDNYISYDGTYKTTEDTVVAVLPVGYYEGYARSLSNKGVVVINGHYAPIVGIVCMNLMVVDITRIPDVTIETTVTLLGDYPQVNIYDIAERAGTIPLEFITGINSAIPRIIV